ncbi:MAG TPA: isocitrate lyase/phosphoenolpyruvate mutase family protein [Segeticoccus sp.]|uniref:isocitrate lyase/PEP mutase family protein n=1 Tax=Segeticoccus sp. TaxID=2706531 RepID=UPI002D800C3B|nr:isocitrate lyase/phosphoenolpyruvate mutase family protein [Segeticoccus sp.]HET8599995.1 isocitrate lyase/phosphoenolpyruvate mutase family protein [Segeticoccus sp.]
MVATADAFLELHTPGTPLLLPNAWDVGSAKVLASLGFRALATTSSGYAATLGRLDNSVSRAEALAHAAELGAATGLPINADLENCYADEPEGVAETIRLAAERGIAGASVEDYTGDPSRPMYEFDFAVERVRAAVETAHAGPRRLVLVARADNGFHGIDDLDDTIRRLQAYQEAGADVLYAPGPTDAEDIRRIVESVDRPVNVLARPGTPSVAELAELGVARISVGGSFAFAALGALVDAATELRDHGTYGYAARSAVGGQAARQAFSAPEAAAQG